jgi:hypothetical protein
MHPINAGSVLSVNSRRVPPFPPPDQAGDGVVIAPRQLGGISK